MCFGALAWATTLSVAIVVAGLGMAGLGLLVVARWPESRHPRSSGAGRWAVTRSAVRQGLYVARGDRTIRLVLAATLLVNGGAQGYGRVFERHLIDLGIPLSPEPIVWFAAIGLAAAALGATRLYWVEARIDGAGVAKATYVAAAGTAATGLVLFALVPSVEVAVTASLVVRGPGFPIVRVASTILVNRRTTSAARATVHSLLSQAENLGEILCGALLAAVAATRSPTITLVASALLVASAGVTVDRAPTGDHETLP